MIKDNWEHYRNIDISNLGINDPHMHEIFLELYQMNWVPEDPQKEIVNQIEKTTFFWDKSIKYTTWQKWH